MTDGEVVVKVDSPAVRALKAVAAKFAALNGGDLADAQEQEEAVRRVKVRQEFNAAYLAARRAAREQRFGGEPRPSVSGAKQVREKKEKTA